MNKQTSDSYFWKEGSKSVINITSFSKTNLIALLLTERQNLMMMKKILKSLKKRGKV